MGPDYRKPIRNSGFGKSYPPEVCTGPNIEAPRSYCQPWSPGSTLRRTIDGNYYYVVRVVCEYRIFPRPFRSSRDVAQCHRCEQALELGFTARRVGVVRIHIPRSTTD